MNILKKTIKERLLGVTVSNTYIELIPTLDLVSEYFESSNQEITQECSNFSKTIKTTHTNKLDLPIKHQDTQDTVEKIQSYKSPDTQDTVEKIRSYKSPDTQDTVEKIRSYILSRKIEDALMKIDNKIKVAKDQNLIDEDLIHHKILDIYFLHLLHLYKLKESQDQCLNFSSALFSNNNYNSEIIQIYSRIDIILDKYEDKSDLLKNIEDNILGAMLAYFSLVKELYKSLDNNLANKRIIETKKTLYKKKLML